MADLPCAPTTQSRGRSRERKSRRPPCRGGGPPQFKLNIEVVGCSHAAVPMSRFLDGALLLAEVDIDQTKPLAVTFGPFVIVEQAPGMVTTHVGAILDGACEFGQMAAVKFDASHVGHFRGVVRQRTISVGAAVLGDLDDGAVVFL